MLTKILRATGPIGLVPLLVACYVCYKVPVPKPGVSIQGKHYGVRTDLLRKAVAPQRPGKLYKHRSSNRLADTFVRSSRDNATNQFLERCSAAVGSSAISLMVFLMEVHHRWHFPFAPS